MVTLSVAVAQECLRLADFLSTLTETQWDAWSLCEKWRTREVIAHLTMPARYTPERFGAEMAECGGDFTVMSDRAAGRDGALPTVDLVADLRSEVMQAFTPPGGGYAGALNHVVIHGLDITTALGVARVSSDRSIHNVLDELVLNGGAARFGRQLSDLRLVADDLDWSFGSGRTVSQTVKGPAGELALFLCNRRVSLRSS